jgi:hypothetical protein
LFDRQRIGLLRLARRRARPRRTPEIQLSSHLFPEVSTHLSAMTPARDRLEIVDWAAPLKTIISAIERSRLRSFAFDAAIFRRGRRRSGAIRFLRLCSP